MEWWLVIFLIFGGLAVLLASGLPVAFSFLLVNAVGVIVLWGGEPGLRQLTTSMFSTLTSFVFLPIPMFVLMGELMFQSGTAGKAIDSLDKLMGRLPGRLGVLAVASGTLLSTCTGSSIGTAALLGETLLPEMERRGCKRPMSLGPILGSGGLAIMIPPSSIAVVLAAIAEISIAGILIAAIIPGLMMAVLYIGYIILRCWLQPSIAPAHLQETSLLGEKIKAFAKYVLPLGVIIFMVTGVILLGIATPSEAAATGALASLIVVIFYRKLTWQSLKKAAFGTMHITIMVFMIIVTSTTFSQILAFSGASSGMAESVVRLQIAPVGIIILMQVVLLFLGMFVDPMSMIMCTMPVFMPIVRTLGFDPIWFGVLSLLNIEMGQTTPPFGPTLFSLKGVAPPDVTMGELITAALPFLICDAIVLGLLTAIPSLCLWLPSLMG